MAYDPTRPVPWRRLLRLLAVYLVGVNVIIYLLGRNDYDAGVAASTLVGGALYLAVSVLLVKFGWDPFRFGKRPARPASTSRGATGSSASKASGTSSAAERAKPPATKRTNAGNPKAKRP